MLNLLKEHEGFSEIASSPMGEWTLPWLPGSALTLFAAALYENSRSSVCVIVPTEAKAMTLARDLEETGLPSEAVRFFPDRDLFRENPEIQPERAEVFAGIARGSKILVVGSLRSILHLTFPPGQVRSLFRRVRLGESIPMESLLDLLVCQGYRRVAQVEARGEFAVRGGILDLFCPQETVPFRLEWWGDQIHSIRTFDPGSQRRHPTSGSLPEEIFLFPAAEPLFDPMARENLVSAIRKTGAREHMEALSQFQPRWEQGFSYFEREWYLRTLLGGEWSFADSLPPDTLYLLLDPLQLERQSAAIQEEMESLFGPHLKGGELFPIGSSPYLSYRQLPERLKGPTISFSAGEDVGESLLGECRPLPGFSRNLDAFLESVRLRLSEGRRIVIASHQSSRIKEILSENEIASFPLAHNEIPEKGRAHVISSRFQEGFFWPALDLVLMTDKELFGFQETQTIRRKQPVAFVLRPGELKEGDFVVHMHHGIGIFRGVKRLLISGVEKDY
ncbi:MAG: hypothetical protein HYU64_08270, partial [Armatimonadetes bacterium]|nr:hypothetical protein [Armatimonadota bacterium]